MTRNKEALNGRTYMAELERILNRKRTTIRKWEREGQLPKKLMPKRDEIGWRYWTPSQVAELKKFAERMKRRQGIQARAA